jgi:hypothetical protein
VLYVKLKQQINSPNRTISSVVCQIVLHSPACKVKQFHNVITTIEKQMSLSDNKHTLTHTCGYTLRTQYKTCFPLAPLALLTFTTAISSLRLPQKVADSSNEHVD